jgi:hypothetical protein
MLKFIIDEDMPRSTAKVLRTEGYESLDVRDLGLRGESDDYNKCAKFQLL